jgi:hypothetical protein
MTTEPRKHWPFRETLKIAADAVTCAEHGDHLGCRKLTIKLLEEHRRYMIPQGERWLRAGRTIRAMEAQG